MESAYSNGSQLTLAVRERGRDGAVPPQQITVQVLEPMSLPTMSVVLKVNFRDAHSGCERMAVLKLFDRRFSPELRRRHNPSYDHDDEAAWQEYVQTDKAGALFAFMDEKGRLEDEEGEILVTDSETDPSSSDDDDGDGHAGKKKKVGTPAETWEKKGKREGISQWKARHSFTSETHAYATLSHLQGRYIPKLLAEVHLKLPTPPGLQNTAGYRHEYFDVGGILLDHVDGFNLTDLGTTDIPEQEWHGIVQRAVDAARYINDAGVINLDCQPRNVIVQRKTLKPFHIDFGRCLFAENMGWKKFGELKSWTDNQGEIGSIMSNKLRRAGVGLPEILYVDRDWGLFGSILTRLHMEAAPWAGIGYGVGAGIGVGVFAWVVARCASAFRSRR
ncbi:hypothetical protein OQA88_7011 [Cercophora sp. LCS_1]